MFYSVITPNIFFDIISVAAYAMVGLFAFVVLFAAVGFLILRCAFVALGKTNFPPAETVSIDELATWFKEQEKEPAATR